MGGAAEGDAAWLVERLKRVDFLAPLDETTLRELALGSRREHYGKGKVVVAEFEAGADVFVILDGQAETWVGRHDGGREVVGSLKPGDAFGEMASLTGELRSATITALEPLDTLRISDTAFEQLRERRPQVAAVLARKLAEYLAAAERTLDMLVAAEPASAVRAAGISHSAPRRGSLRRVWRALVVNRQRELPFLTLASFVVTLLAVRLAVYVSFRFDVVTRGILRTAYITGFGLLVTSAAASLLTYRSNWRRFVACAYGVSCALILNSLGVTLAFDIFYKDIHTPDPNVPFDIEQLYRRTEPQRALLIAGAVLVQAAYLRPFYRRAWFIIKTRLRLLRGRH